MHNVLENRVLNIGFYALTILVNGLANGLPLNGQTTGQVSAKYPALLTPAGYAFSIWGLIYIALTAFVIYQLLPAQKNNELIKRINPFFKVSCLANAAWIFAWHYGALFTSLILMVILLIALIAIYRSLYAVANRPTLSEYLFVYFPFSLYTGWIAVATIVNISAVQTGMGWDNIGFQEVTWALIKLAITGGVAAIVILRKADAVFGLVIAWAAYAISVKQVAVPDVSGGALIISLLAVLLVCFVLSQRVVLRTRRTSLR